MRSCLLVLNPTLETDAVHNNQAVMGTFRNSLLADLVLAGHRSILNESFTKVLCDIREDEFLYRAIKNEKENTDEFQQRLANKIEQYRMMESQKSLEEKEAHFLDEEKYNLGNEDLNTLPPKMIEEIAERLLLLLRDNIVNLESKGKEAFRPFDLSILDKPADMILDALSSGSRSETKFGEVIYFLATSFRHLLSERLAKVMRERSIDNTGME